MKLEITELTYPSGSSYGVFVLDGVEIGKADKCGFDQWRMVRSRIERSTNDMVKALLEKRLHEARAAMRAAEQTATQTTQLLGDWKQQQKVER